MGTLSIALPAQKAQTAFNLRRWEEIRADPRWTCVEGRIETDRHGRVLMSPPPAPQHGSYQSEIAYLLRSLLEEGRVLTECPISTSDGVRAADVAWASAGSMRLLGNRVCFPRAPEICVEVLSPGNRAGETREKMELHFDAGAVEVWLCDDFGRMSFYLSAGGRAVRRSRLCPRFPERVELR